MTPSAVALLAVLVAGGAVGLQSGSAVSAPHLVQLMAVAGLDVVAAEDPDEPGRFVAGLAVPGQLLVVTARCAGGAASLRARIAVRAFRELYADLHACAEAPSKLFVHDMGGDGLHANLDGDRVPDVVYEMAAHRILLDGDWRTHELTKEGYTELWLRLDARYDRLLDLLAATLQPPTAATAEGGTRATWR